MAKELPYFKFEPNQWENGSVQICTREEKGLFIDLCSMYWSRLGDVPVKLAIQKLCAGNATALDSLIEDEIFAVINGMICIDFLNEQLSEFESTSVQNSKNAREGWAKRRKNATALISQSETQAIRGEERREEEENKTLTEEMRELISLISEKFNLKELTANHRVVTQFVLNCVDLNVFTYQHKYYHLYKEKAEEKKHGIISFIGSAPLYDNGAWNECDWKTKYKSASNGKKKSFEPEKVTSVKWG